MPQGNSANVGRQAERVRRLVARGRKLLDNWDDEDDIERARTLFQQATELKPDSAEAWQGLADAFEEDEEHALALHAYGHAIELGAGGVDLWRGVARAASRLPAHLEEGVAAIERARALSPDDVELLNDYADLLTKAGLLSDRPDHLHRALEALEYARTLQPADAWSEQLLRTLAGRGGLFLQLGRDAEGLVAYDELIQRATAQPDGWLKASALSEAYRGHALTLDRLGRTEEALAALEEGVTYFPDHADTSLWRAYLAELHMRLGRHDAALAAIQPAIGDDQWQARFAPIWRAYARVLRTHGRETEAQEAEAAAESFPEGPDLVTFLLPN